MDSRSRSQFFCFAGHTLVLSVLLTPTTGSFAQATFSKVTSGPAVTDGADGEGCAWVDFNGDGMPDLFVANNDSNMLYRDDGNSVFTRITTGPIVNAGPGSESASWADYDNDGWLDLFVMDFLGQHNRLYHNNGDGTFTRILTGSVVTDSGSSTDPIFGDYDRDGFLDLFVANGTNGGGDSNDSLYHNNGDSNAWITIKCVGTVSNRSAIGAKVRAKGTINGKTFWQTRTIGVGGAGNPLEAHFGLGNATNVETLRIEWPSGTMQEFQNVPAKQYLAIAEPSRLVVSATNGVPLLQLQGGRNMQYGVQISTNLTTWSMLGTLTITNLNGIALITDTNSAGSDDRFYRAQLR